MKILLDDTNSKAGLYPFTATRHTADIRIGILTIREKWAYLTNASIKTNPVYPVEPTYPGEPGYFRIDAGIIPTNSFCDDLEIHIAQNDRQSITMQGDKKVKTLLHPWQIFQLNDWALREDFKLITTGRNSQALSATNQVNGIENIFLEEGAVVEHCIINATTGPVYIGKNATLMEGCMVRGPFALCEGAMLKMGAKVYGATTIGPYCTAGGEIKNAIMFGYSNKAHDGYLGDSVIGEWCNLGAGTSNSNVKNSAGEVKVWSNAATDYLPVGIKCGLLMGDYSRAAINTSFNTGTVVGVCCNIFGEGFPPKFISNFTWGKERYTFEKILQDIQNWKKLKGQDITEQEINTLKHLYTQ